jgi:hypothetical protein
MVEQMASADISNPALILIRNPKGIALARTPELRVV